MISINLLHILIRLVMITVVKRLTQMVIFLDRLLSDIPALFEKQKTQWTQAN